MSAKLDTEILAKSCNEALGGFLFQPVNDGLLASIKASFEQMTGGKVESIKKIGSKIEITLAEQQLTFDFTCDCTGEKEANGRRIC